MKKTEIVLLILVLSICFGKARAQVIVRSTIDAVGSSNFASSLGFSYSSGQPSIVGYSVGNSSKSIRHGFIQGRTSLSNEYNSVRLLVFPSITSQFIQFKIPDLPAYSQPVCKYWIHSLDGRMLSTGFHEISDPESLDVSNLFTGLHILTVLFDNNYYFGKFVKI